MADTRITTGEINELMNAAVTAIGTGDFPTAYIKALQAQGLMLAKPRSSYEREELEWYPEKIEQFLNRVNDLKRSAATAAGGSIVQIPVRRVSSRTGADECA